MIHARSCVESSRGSSMSGPGEAGVVCRVHVTTLAEFEVAGTRVVTNVWKVEEVGNTLNTGF